MVSVQNVSKEFSGSQAVIDASFELGRGKFLTILGPSGSGKTTLLRMIAGFIAPSAGEIFIHGAPVSSVPPHQRSIGMVFQKLALFPHMTAAENVAYPLKMRRFNPKEIAPRVERYLNIVQLQGLGGRRIHQLSGGQQQRVAIARALVFEPDLLLLDEPLAALDKKLREEMQLEFRRIQRELGVTTINVTHDQREALVMSDEIIVMDYGRIQQRASPIEAYRNPANAFVAGFIGVTNYLEGRIGSVLDDRISVAIGPLTLQGRCSDPELRARAAAHDIADCALRAEQIRIADRQGDIVGADTIIEGRVRETIFEGDRIVYEVALEPLPGIVLRVFDHAQHHAGERVAGARVFIGWNARDFLVFPR
jgi:putative spermidine/putrescine transport system ATP-binding protein